MLDRAHTARQLESYVLGGWRRGAGEGKPLLNAATGETHATITSDGLDFAGALDWGRDVGGAALRRHTIHERALMEMKDDFHAESLATGATPKDAWPDIEGGIGTLLTFASRARRELPNVSVLTEQAQVPLAVRNDAIQTVVRPAAGGITFASGIGSETVTVQRRACAASIVG